MNIDCEWQRFPPNIQHKFECKLPNPFIVRLPNNATWKMKYEDKDGWLWFTTGWGRFCKDLSLKRNYFIVWEYNFTDVFDVIILKSDKFGQGMVITYPPVKAADGVMHWPYIGLVCFKKIAPLYVRFKTICLLFVGGVERGSQSIPLCEFAVEVTKNNLSSAKLVIFLFFGNFLYVNKYSQSLITTICHSFVAHPKEFGKKIYCPE